MTTTTPRFALIGAAGFVAPRHLQAIKDVGGKLVAALDPHDAVGVLDRFDRDTEFFTDEHRFERHLEKLRRDGAGIDWLVVCSPNYLHDTHVRLGLRSWAKVICEKPLVLDPKNLDALLAIEREYARQGQFYRPMVFTVLQLRHVPVLQQFKRSLVEHSARPAKVHLRYVTPRGRWYRQSWKGDETKSGGLITNIGIHMLDLLLWLLGPNVHNDSVVERSPTRVAGDFVIDTTYVSFELSIEGEKAERELTVDGVGLPITGFEDLHTTVYRETLAGRGYGIEDARPAIELAYRLRQQR